MNLLNKSNIINGNIIEASDVSQIVDAFTYQVAYDLLISGSVAIGSGSTAPGVKLYITGGNVKIDASVSASSFTGSFLGNGVNVTGVISSSYAISSSYSNFAVTALTASVANNISGASGFIPVFSTPLTLGTSLIFQSASSIIVNNGSGPSNFNLDIGGTGRFTSNLTISGTLAVNGNTTIKGSTTLQALTLNGLLTDNVGSTGTYGQVLQSIGTQDIWVSTVSSSVSSSFATTSSYALNANIAASVSGTVGYYPIFTGVSTLGTGSIRQTGSLILINNAPTYSNDYNISISGSTVITAGTGSSVAFSVFPLTSSADIGTGMSIRADGNISFGPNTGIFYVQGTEYLRLPSIGGFAAGTFSSLAESGLIGWEFLNSSGSLSVNIYDNIVARYSMIDSSQAIPMYFVYTGSITSSLFAVNFTMVPGPAIQNHFQGTNVTLKAGDGGLSGSIGSDTAIPANLYLSAGNAQSGTLNANTPGGNVFVSGGFGTGNGTPGTITFYTSTPTASGTIPHSFAQIAQMSASNVSISGNFSVNGVQYVSVNVQSGSTYTISGSYQYVFAGTASAVWTLPSLTGSVGNIFKIKHRGTGSLILSSSSGGNDLFSTTPATSSIISAGNSATLVNDGTYWLVE